MGEQTIAMEIPQPLYQRLQRLAEVTQRPISTLVVQAIDQSVSPLLDKLSPAMLSELADLESFADDHLWEVARSQVGGKQHARYTELLDKERSGRLSEAESEELDALYHSFNVHMLRKAFAAGLLRWRGYAIPSPANLSEPR